MKHHFLPLCTRVRSTVQVLAMLFAFCFLQAAHAQNIGINGTGAAADASAILDVAAADKGLLVPRVALTSTADVATVPAPATSLLVYNTATVSNVSPGFYYWDGALWRRLSGADWSLAGNAGTNPAANFLGTTDGQALVFRTANVERGRFTPAGRLGVGEANPADLLHVSGGDVRIGEVNPNNTGAFPGFGRRLYFSGGPSGALYNSDNSDPIWMVRYNDAQDNSELRLNLGDNCGSPNDAFVIQTGGAGCPANTVYFRMDLIGNAYRPGGGAWLALSDRRLKEDIADYEAGLSTLQRIRPVTYRYNGLADTPQDGRSYVGVIAQEIQEAMPEVVHSYGDYLSVDPSAFTYVLINSVQEQQEQIEALSADKSALEAEMEGLLQRMESLEAQIGQLLEQKEAGR